MLAEQVQEPELGPQLPHTLGSMLDSISHALVTLLTVLAWSLLGMVTCVGNLRARAMGPGGFLGLIGQPTYLVAGPVS